MNNNEKNFIEILSSFVNDKKPELSADADAKALYELARAQSLTGVVSYVLNKYGFDDLLKADERLKSAYDKTITQLIRKDFEAQRIFAMLSALKVPHITFKGLAIKECYPIPELRTFGDIDIIIREEDKEKVRKMMVEQGFSCEAMDNGAVYGYKKKGEFYEIHNTLNSERTKLSEFMRDYWSQTKLRDGFTYEFKMEFHFAYLISHIEKHVNCSSAGIRLYLDIALFLKKHREELDLDKVKEILKECKLEKFYDTVLFLCNKWFGTEKLFEQGLTDKVYEDFCLFTLRGGTFGVISDGEIRRSMDSTGKVSKARLIISHIFPPYREIRRMYSFVDGRPYLLFAGWVLHWFNAAKRSGLKNIKRVASADVKEAQEEKNLLKQVGSSR